MLTKLKKTTDKNGAISSAGQAKKGSKGRIEVYVERTGEEYELQFLDFGNYGKIRWTATLPATEDDVADMIIKLQDLLDGEINSTKMDNRELNELMNSTQSESEQVVEAESVEETENSPLVADEPVENIEQLGV